LYDDRCPKCGTTLVEPDKVLDYKRVSRLNTSKPIISGLLMIITGLLLFATVAILSFVGSSLLLFSGVATALCLSIGIAVVALLVIVAGANTLGRRNFRIALIGAVIATVGGLLFTFFAVGSVLGLVSLVLILLSKHEFDSERYEPPPS